MINAREFLSSNHNKGNCAVCGGVVEQENLNIKKVVSSSFTDWDTLFKGGGTGCCNACMEIIKEPKMRSKCVLSTKSGSIEFVDYTKVYDVITNPIEQFVVSVPYSYKRHHWLYAGLSTPQRMLIGTDSCTIEYIPNKHKQCLESIVTMREMGVPLRQIETGQYTPAYIAIMGDKYNELESNLLPNRGTGLVRFLCKISPKDKKDFKGDEIVRTTEQDNTALFLSVLAKSSKYRIENGIAFWGGFFEARVNRVIGLPFDIATNKLMKSLHCNPNSGISEIIDGFTDVQKTSVMSTLKEQAKVCIALAYSDTRKEK